MSYTVYCDQCGKDIAVNLVTIKVREDIEKTYFTCPHCGVEYTSFYTNTAIRRRQEKLRKLAEQIRQTKSNGVRNKLAKEFERLQKKNLKEGKALREKMEG